MSASLFHLNNLRAYNEFFLLGWCTEKVLKYDVCKFYTYIISVDQLSLLSEYISTTFIIFVIINYNFEKFRNKRFIWKISNRTNCILNVILLRWIIFNVFYKLWFAQMGCFEWLWTLWLISTHTCVFIVYKTH